MLKKLRLKDFKSFADEEVELAPLTLLLGANASGKSNFLDAIRFLQGIESDLTLAEVLNGEESSRPDAWPGLRGKAPEAARLKTGEFTLRSTWLAPDLARWPERREKAELVHSITCSTEPLPRLLQESYSALSASKAQCFKTADDGTIEILDCVLGSATRTSLSPERSLLRQDLDLRLAQDNPEVVLRRLALRYHLSRIHLLELQPDQMRGYGRRGTPLGSEGKNLSGVLADSCSEPQEKQILVEWLSELSASELQDIDFAEIKELGDVMAFFIEKDGRRISARSISDGTLRFLGILLALRTAEEGSVYLIEEVGAGLHPARIRLLVDFLARISEARDIQVIATTHSPVVLQWLSDEVLRNAVAFGRVPDHEGTLMRRLGDLPDFDEAVAHAGIEELFATGWVEMAL